MIAIPETANKGLENITACTSSVSMIHDTTLLYRGYTIEDLASFASFEEVIYLLWFERFPTEIERATFQAALLKEAHLSEQTMNALRLISKSPAHPMAKLRSAISLIGSFDKTTENTSLEAMRTQALRCTAQLGCAATVLSRLEREDSFGSTFAFDQKQTFAWNVLHTFLGRVPLPEDVVIFDTALVLHADHELNASAFTARVVASTNSDYYSAITAAIASLKGPLHGGANERVMAMLNEIGGFKNVHLFIEDALNAKKKVMGIGHRVYKNGDPRARILKQCAQTLSKKRGLEDSFQVLSLIEEEMLTKKGLMPNVDFYSGLVYTCLGLKPTDFTPIFAISRIAGWSAQIFEQIQNNRIYRPRAHYTGPTNHTLTGKQPKSL